MRRNNESTKFLKITPTSTSIYRSIKYISGTHPQWQKFPRRLKLHLIIKMAYSLLFTVNKIEGNLILRELSINKILL